ncbi:MAG TPA: serine protease [Thermoanaerobaculia bacterium]|nr:serine protease [Thermoanaerobaculia bacterium]
MPSEDVLVDVLQGDPVDRLLGIATDRAVVDIGLDPVAKPDADKKAVKAALKLATNAAKKVAESGAKAKLTDKEKDALDLFILLVSRPAIFVRKGTVAERPENWPEVEKSSEVLPRVIAGVGRIENAARGGRGTGFIVGPRRILTNNHVLCSLFGLMLNAWQAAPDDFAKLCKSNSKVWSKKKKTDAPFFELRGELGSKDTSTARVTRILGHHLEVDMAVLELDADPKGSRQLSLSKDEPPTFKGRRIYAVGYPMVDSNKVTPVPVFKRVFGADEKSLGTKRFSPGTIIEWGGAKKFSHDASTLAGSSGSAIVDFEQGSVVGLHYSGNYNIANNAVPLWKFKDDPVLVDNGVVFG